LDEGASRAQRLRRVLSVRPLQAARSPALLTLG
jgi:hypothetical protein